VFVSLVGERYGAETGAFLNYSSRVA
jgi:hypothetical protein